jgi:hypothetical protein
VILIVPFVGAVGLKLQKVAELKGRNGAVVGEVGFGKLNLKSFVWLLNVIEVK